MLALLIAAGKRRGDIVQENHEPRKRKSLANYNVAFLDAMLTAMTGGTLVVYLLFCVSDYAVARFGDAVLITAVPVALGLLRYLQLIIVQGRGESPTDLVLGDRGLLADPGDIRRYLCLPNLFLSHDDDAKRLGPGDRRRRLAWPPRGARVDARAPGDGAARRGRPPGTHAGPPG